MYLNFVDINREQYYYGLTYANLYLPPVQMFLKQKRIIFKHSTPSANDLEIGLNLQWHLKIDPDVVCTEEFESEILRLEINHVEKLKEINSMIHQKLITNKRTAFSSGYGEEWFRREENKPVLGRYLQSITQSQQPQYVKFDEQANWVHQPSAPLWGRITAFFRNLLDYFFPGRSVKAGMVHEPLDFEVGNEDTYDWSTNIYQSLSGVIELENHNKVRDLRVSMLNAVQEKSHLDRDPTASRIALLLRHSLIFQLPVEAKTGQGNALENKGERQLAYFNK